MQKQKLTRTFVQYLVVLYKHHCFGPSPTKDRQRSVLSRKHYLVQALYALYQGTVLYCCSIWPGWKIPRTDTISLQLGEVFFGLGQKLMNWPRTDTIELCLDAEIFSGLGQSRYSNRFFFDQPRKPWVQMGRTARQKYTQTSDSPNPPTCSLHTVLYVLWMCVCTFVLQYVLSVFTFSWMDYYFPLWLSLYMMARLCTAIMTVCTRKVDISTSHLCVCCKNAFFG